MIYLDNSATTRCSDRATEVMVQLLQKEYGNPSSLHLFGAQAEDYIKEAKKKIAKTLKADEKEIIFTSGGTESNNLAIFGAVEANKRAGNKIITTSIEHASVEQPMARLEELGYDVVYLDVDSNGIIDLEQLERELNEQTILVSIMHVNNEIGAVEPIEQAAELIAKKAKNALFHVDAIQSYGKYRIIPKKIGIDLLSVSGHKIHGPKGSGFLYVKSKTKIKPILFGGGQQKGMRSGTENVPAIAGLAEAAEEAYEHLEENVSKMRALKAMLLEGISSIPDVTVNGLTDERSAPHILSVSVKDVRSEVLLHSLEEKEIYVSAGSACSSNKPSISRTLKNIGIKEYLLDATIRFSLCEANTEEEMKAAAAAMQEMIPFRRKFIRR